MILINDLHIGTVRSAGTTPATALALRGYALLELEKMLGQINEDLVVNGDLFDQYQIPMEDLLSTYRLLHAWLDKGHKLTGLIGNHDQSNDSSKLSSFQFLFQLLLANPNVQFIQGGAWVDKALGVYGLSHVANQDLLDLELTRVPPCKYLLLHANYNNYFAKESDHSLNVSEDQVKASKADVLVFAHEHNHRTALAGKVFVKGNQFPMSVSDCLSEQDKFMHRLTSNGIERIKTWDRESNYKEIDWRDPVESEARFIRFVGTCTSEESALAADTISRYRRQSDAFVIGNAVKVQTAEGQAQLEVDSLEAVRAFDIMGALKDYLTESEWGIIQGLK